MTGTRIARSEIYVISYRNAKQSLLELGMNIFPDMTDSRVADVRITPDRLAVVLKDGREISAPLEWFPRLKAASPAQREEWESSAAGYGIHWPQIDEDLSVRGLLRVSGDSRTV